MADTVALFSKLTSWTSTGTGDTLTCQDIPQNRHGVQIDADGISFESATITITNSAGGTKVYAAPDGSGNTCIAGEGAAISKIVISGVAAGTYPVRFSG